MSTVAVEPPTLMEHQVAAVDFITTRPASAIWIDIGGGKSLTTLTALQHIQPSGHILVIAPVAIARSTWLNEIQDWQLPIRTKSLIADENDRQLSKDQRLQRFAEVFDDEPTMYFINQELLTQSSNQRHVLTSAPRPNGITVSDQAEDLYEFVSGHAPLTRDELVETYRIHVQHASGSSKPPAKSVLNNWIKELVEADMLTRERRFCPHCMGDGCPGCTFGLVDQMPVKDINGTKTIIWPFQTVIIDESQEFKSHSSKRFQALQRVRGAITRLIELTGTPSPNGLHDLWSQIWLLDQGAALGENVTAFRDRWFTPKMIPGQTIPVDWIPNPGAEAEIHAAISHLVMSAKNTNLAMPPEPYVDDVAITLDEDLMASYRRFRRELVIDVIGPAAEAQARAEYSQWFALNDTAAPLRRSLSGLDDAEFLERYTELCDTSVEATLSDPVQRQRLMQTVIAANQAVLTSKLMQFASGTLYTSDPDEPSTANQYEVIHDRKIVEVERIIAQAGDEPVLLAYHFKSDKRELLTRLSAAGITVEAFDGSRAMDRRWNAREIPVMLVHPASAGAGLNLQFGGSILIWFTVPFSLKHYQQTNGRLHRPGQTKRVTIHRLLTTGTQDTRMPSVLRGKAAVQDNLLRAVSHKPLEQALGAELDEDITDLCSDH